MTVDITPMSDTEDWFTWTRKVTPYSGTQLCVIIDKDVMKELDLDAGVLVEGRIKGPLDRWVPFTKRIQRVGGSKCIYLDHALLDATGLMRGDQVEVRIRRLD